MAKFPFWFYENLEMCVCVCWGGVAWVCVGVCVYIFLNGFERKGRQRNKEKKSEASLLNVSYIAGIELCVFPNVISLNPSNSSLMQL